MGRGSNKWWNNPRASWLERVKPGVIGGITWETHFGDRKAAVGRNWTSRNRPNDVTVVIGVRGTIGGNGGTSRKSKEPLIIRGLVNGNRNGGYRTKSNCG